MSYWVGGTGNWSDDANHWAATSGGTPGVGNLPTSAINAVWDANSNATAYTVTFDVGASCKALNFSAGPSSSGTITVDNNGLAINTYGDITLLSGMSFSAGGGNISVQLSGNLTSNGVSITGTSSNVLALIGSNAVLTLQDNAVVSGTGVGTLLRRGTLDLNGHTLTTPDFASTPGLGAGRTVKDSVGGGKIITTDTSAATVWNSNTDTVYDQTNAWTIEIGGNTTNTRTFAGGGRSYPTVTFTNTTPNGTLNFTGSNTFKSIVVSSPAQTLNFTAGTTTTITDANGFPSGTASNLVTIGSITASSHTLSKSGGGQVSVDYLSVSYSAASPANTWYAGTHSTDGGNNSGWTFSAPAVFNVGWAVNATQIVGVG